MMPPTNRALSAHAAIATTVAALLMFQLSGAGAQAPVPARTPEQKTKQAFAVPSDLGPAVAQGATPISVVTFPSPHNWPIWVAQEKGYFDRNGLAVTLAPTPSSEFLMTGLINGEFDIAMAGIDNVIAYMEGQGGWPVKAADEAITIRDASDFLRAG